jgi:hypothetical protein
MIVWRAKYLNPEIRKRALRQEMMDEASEALFLIAW